MLRPVLGRTHPVFSVKSAISVIDQLTISNVTWDVPVKVNLHKTVILHSEFCIIPSSVHKKTTLFLTKITHQLRQFMVEPLISFCYFNVFPTVVCMTSIKPPFRIDKGSLHTHEFNMYIKTLPELWKRDLKFGTQYFVMSKAGITSSVSRQI